MKRILILLVFVAISLGVSAQREQTKTLTVDSLQGNNNVTLGEIPVSGHYNSLFVKVKMERVSTAAGGTLYFKSGLDSASVLVNNQSTNPAYGFAPNDSLALADVATQYWNIYVPNPETKTYHVFGDGDANDTVKVTINYYLK